MFPMTPASQQSSAQWNRHLLIRLLQQHGALSQRQIASLTDIGGSTLSNLVRDLLDRQILRTGGKHDSGKVGPKQVLLEINPQLGHVIGIDLHQHTMHLVVRNMAGGLIDMWDEPFSGKLDDLPSQLARVLDSRPALNDSRLGPRLSLALGVPGVVDVASGVILHSVLFDVQDYPLCRKLQEALDIPYIQVDHNANFAALAEAREGAARGMEQFILFLINPDIIPARARYMTFGAAIYLGDKVHRGIHFAAGELDSQLAPPLPALTNHNELEVLYRLDEPISPFLADLADRIGRMVGSLANLLDPQAVVVSGGRSIVNSQFIEHMRERVSKALLPVPRRRTEIPISTLGAQAVARGAALSAADTVLLEQGVVGVTAASA